jgi:hypothetical protein
MLAAEPRIDGYWRLVAELWGPGRPTPGAAHAWLRTALPPGPADPGAAPDTAPVQSPAA